ncbi:hypothetical protein FG93_02202 [Bosea sp. LC85]|nr:hypothetical protein FG93_02202 [Bosea sp. LC85]
MGLLWMWVQPRHAPRPGAGGVRRELPRGLKTASFCPSPMFLGGYFLKVAACPFISAASAWPLGVEGESGFRHPGSDVADGAGSVRAQVSN